MPPRASASAAAALVVAASLSLLLLSASLQGPHPSPPVSKSRMLSAAFARRVLRPAVRMSSPPLGRAVGRLAFGLGAQGARGLAGGSSGDMQRATCAQAMVAPSGYEVLKEEDLEEYAAKATLLKHKKTGAEILSMEKDDDNKVFGIAFRTPVDDSMGIPHILEHSVLCGSRKFPSKSPFIELRKSSLHTFLNAMTYPDRTLYPVASQNEKDFYNLAEVYLDSVLHPRAAKDPLVMAQEGWHYQIQDEQDDALKISGVVYNEMKGVYSSPDSLHARGTIKALFPDVNYAEDSGGDPVEIPNLTYEKFKTFHQAYYHPSNSRIFFYGNDPVEKRFELISSYLDEFEALPGGSGHSMVPTQELKGKPWSFAQSIPAPKGQEDKKHMATVGWVVSEEPFSELEGLSWDLIDQLLLGNTAAKLRKTLSDSGLGSSVLGGGMSTYLKQPFYTVGLKGLESAQVGIKVQKLVMEVLQEAASDGFDQAAIDAALNRVEFSLREFDTASTQRGMAFLFGAMSDWNYNRDPVKGFKFENTLAELKDKLSSDEAYLQNLIQTRLIDNPHRVLVTSSPDSTLEEKKEKELEEKLARDRETMTTEQLDSVRSLMEQLKERQATPDPPEVISKIPRLTVSDLDRDTKTIPEDKETIDGVNVLTHTLSTNGIVYADAALDISDIDVSLLPVLNLFTRIASGATGTQGKDRVQLRQHIDTHTGGVSCSWGSSTKVDRNDQGLTVVRSPKTVQVRLYMRGKATAEKADTMFDLFNEMLYSCRLDDQERIVQMLKESKSGMEASLVGRGNSYAVGRLSSRNHMPGLLNEMTGGLEYYNTVVAMLEEAQKDFPSLQAKLQRILDYVASRTKEHFTINLTADEKSLEKARGSVSKYVGSVDFPGELKEEKASNTLSSLASKLGGSDAMEGVIIPTQVNYVAMGGRMYQAGERVGGSSSVVTNFLKTGYLWDKIRVMGGAYGAGFSLNARLGTFAFSSYRDPNVKLTIENYRKAADYLINADIPKEEVDRAIIGTISGLDYPQTPNGKGQTSFSRYFTGYTTEDAQRWRDEVLATTADDFKQFGLRLKKALETEGVVGVCAFGSNTALTAAKEDGLDLELKEAFAK